MVDRPEKKKKSPEKVIKHYTLTKLKVGYNISITLEARHICCRKYVLLYNHLNFQKDLSYCSDHFVLFL